MKYLLYFFIPSFLTLLLSPKVIKASVRLGLVDSPDIRKTHHRPTPLAGGMVLFPLVLAASLIALPKDQKLPFFIMAGTMIFLLGILDDARGLHFSTKFFVQIAAALFVMHSGALFELNRIPSLEPLGIHFGHLFSVLVTLVWIVGITNAVNLIDGMDGLASGLSLNAFVGLGTISLIGGRSSLAVFCFIMAGGLLGFLRYNFTPARTFLGDSGSMLLGFTLAVVAILYSTKTTTFLMLVVPALFLTLPMADTTFSFLRRTLKRKNPFKADRRHLHHRLLDLNFSVKQVLGVFFGLSTVLGILTLWVSRSLELGYVALAFLLVCLVVLAIKAMQIINIHDWIRETNQRIRAIARKAVGQPGSGPRRLQRNLALLTGICALNLSFLARADSEARPFFFLATAGLYLLGVLDYSLGVREEEKRYEILHTVIFLSWMVNQFSILVLFPGDFLQNSALAFPAILTMILMGWFLARTGTFAVFLEDPIEILALFMVIAGAEIARHFIGGLTLLPFVLATVNGLVLYTLSKIYLTDYWNRSRTLSAAVSVCTLLLIGIIWVG